MEGYVVNVSWNGDCSDHDSWALYANDGNGVEYCYASDV